MSSDARPVSFLSFDVEALPGRAERDHVDRLVWGRFGGQEHGIGRICSVLDEYGIKGNFLIDMSMCALYGDAAVAKIGEFILSQGHELHVHLHSECLIRHWKIAGTWKGAPGLDQLDAPLSESLLGYAAFKFETLFGKRPMLLRAGGYHFNEHTLQASAEAGFAAVSNYNAGRHGAMWQLSEEALHNEPFRWSCGLVELPVDFSPEPLSVGWGKYTGYFDRAVQRKKRKTFNLVMHSWSLLDASPDMYFDRPSPANEECLRALCKHIREHTQPCGYHNYLMRSDTLPMLREAACKAEPVSIAAPVYRCSVCGMTSGSVPATDVCGGCGSRARHRQIQSTLLDRQDLFKGKEVLACHANDIEKRLMLRDASRLTNFDVRPIAGLDLQMDIQEMSRIPDASIDAFVAIHVLNHVQDDRRALSEIHRILRPGGVALITVPYREGEPTSVHANITEHYGANALAKYGVGSYRRYGFDDVMRQFLQDFEVEAVEGHDGLTNSKSYVFFLKRLLAFSGTDFFRAVRQRSTEHLSIESDGNVLRIRSTLPALAHQNFFADVMSVNRLPSQSGRTIFEFDFTGPAGGIEVGVFLYDEEGNRIGGRLGHRGAKHVVEVPPEARRFQVRIRVQGSLEAVVSNFRIGADAEAAAERNIPLVDSAKALMARLAEPSSAGWKITECPSGFAVSAAEGGPEYANFASDVYRAALAGVESTTRSFSMFFSATELERISLGAIFYDRDGRAVSGQYVRPNHRKEIDVPAAAAKVQFLLRVEAGYEGLVTECFLGANQWVIDRVMQLFEFRGSAAMARMRPTTPLPAHRSSPLIIVETVFCDTEARPGVMAHYLSYLKAHMALASYQTYTNWRWAIYVSTDKSGVADALNAHVSTLGLADKVFVVAYEHPPAGYGTASAAHIDQRIKPNVTDERRRDALFARFAVSLGEDADADGPVIRVCVDDDDFFGATHFEELVRAADGLAHLLDRWHAVAVGMKRINVAYVQSDGRVLIDDVVFQKVMTGNKFYLCRRGSPLLDRLSPFGIQEVFEETAPELLARGGDVCAALWNPRRPSFFYVRHGENLASAGMRYFYASIAERLELGSHDEFAALLVNG